MALSLNKYIHVHIDPISSSEFISIIDFKFSIKEKTSYNNHTMKLYKSQMNRLYILRLNLFHSQYYYFQTWFSDMNFMAAVFSMVYFPGSGDVFPMRARTSSILSIGTAAHPM